MATELNVNNPRNYPYPMNVSGQRVSPYETDATPKFWPGTRFVSHGNRVYRYTWAGATALTAGYMDQSEAPDITHFGDQAQTAVLLPSLTNIPKGAVSFQLVVTTGSALTQANLAHFIGGSMVIEELGTAVSPETRGALGDFYTIVDISWYTYQTVLNVTVSSPIRNTIWTGTTPAKVSLVKSPFMDTIVFPTTGTGLAIGVPNVDVPIGYGYWSQTKGLCGVYIGATVVVGQLVGPYGSTAGAFGPVTDANVLTVVTQVVQSWGRAYQIGYASKYGIVDLMLE
jgi:hypothetical protein